MRRLVIPLIVIVLIFGWLVYRGVRGGHDRVYTGTIEARDAAIGSLMGGRIAEVLVEEGD